MMGRKWWGSEDSDVWDSDHEACPAQGPCRWFKRGSMRDERAGRFA